MKTLALFLALVSTAHAESRWVRFLYIYPAEPPTVTITEGETVTVRSLDNLNQNPASPNTVAIITANVSELKLPVRVRLGETFLGPCVVTCSLNGNPFFPPWDGSELSATLEIQTVNSSPSLPVLPSGTAGVVTLEHSTDLKTWTSTTNGPASAGEGNVFFRVNLAR